MDVLAAGELFTTAAGEPSSSASRAGGADVSALGDVAALTRVLVARLPLRDALAQILALGARLLGDCCALRVYAAENAMSDGTLSLRQVAGLAYASDSRPYTSGEEVAPTPTFGHGAQLDRQVLRDHLSVRAADTTYVPLVTNADLLVGVLAVAQRDTADHTADPAVVTLLADHLTVLLERRERERSTDRLDEAQSMLARLADPLGVTAGLTGRDAEERLLREAAELLHSLAQADAILTLALTSDGQPYVTGAVSGEGHHALSSEQSAALRAALRVGGPVLVSPLAEPDLWRALAGLRDSLRLAPPAAVEINRLTLLPVRSGDTVLGLVLLGHATGAPDPQSWLPLAVAVTVVAAAGIRALDFAAQAAAEARSRDAFISLAAHELRSPLTSIKGYSQLLIRQARKHALPEGMMRSVEAIEQQSMRMAEMVGELLDASRIQRGALELLPATTDLVPLVTRTVDRRRAFVQEHEIALETEAVSLVGNWDTARVEQIVRDLVDNAARFSPEGDAIYIHVSRQDGMALVSVRDEGIGVSDADRDRIFEYLYRAPAAEQRNLSGLGLGLFVSHHLAERMGGSLTLHTTSTVEPTGSEFHLLLPLA
jgi:signal transduction histidine kinase